MISNGHSLKVSLVKIKEIWPTISCVFLRYANLSKFQEWFSRQQLMLAVMVLNISLAIIFFKLLT